MVRGINEIRVSIEGLDALDRALGKADKSLRAGLRKDLKEVVEIVAEDARSIVERKGLRQSGDLIKGIRAFALTGRAGVKSTAIHRGCGYPKRLEFEGRGGNKFGPNASLLPAVNEKSSELETRAEQLLDRFASDFASTS